MRIIFENNNEHFSVNFHQVHLYLKNNKLQYLFVHPIYQYKKYIIDINYNDFKKFIIKCSENKKIINSISEIKSEYDKILNDIISCNNINLKLNFCQKLGELILFNYDNKDVFNIKNIYCLFTVQNNQDNLINSFNCYIRYLIIMINNLNNVEYYFVKNIDFDMIDFIYDYYLD